MNLRTQLAQIVADEVDRRGISQSEMARQMKEPQSQVSLVVNKKLDGFSTERLFRMAMSLSWDIEVQVRPALGKRGKLSSHVQSV